MAVQEEEKKETERVSALGVLRWLTMVARDCAPGKEGGREGERERGAMFLCAVSVCLS